MHEHNLSGGEPEQVHVRGVGEGGAGGAVALHF